MMSNTEVVRQVYERFARGEVPGILAAFDPEIEFRLAEGHPYCPEGKAWHGADEIIAGFFKKAAGQWNAWTVSPETIHEHADTVVVEGRYRGADRKSTRLNSSHSQSSYAV